MNEDGFWDSNKRFSYLVARENAKRMIDDPGMVEVGKAHLERFSRADPHQRDGYELWRAILSLPVADIAARLTERSERGDYARETAPSFGALPNDLRARLVIEARSPIGSSMEPAKAGVQE